jgi:dTMP kinase
MVPRRGKLITIEGPDGSGKSSSIATIVRVLQSHGYDVVTSREPGGTPTGEEIRKVILNLDMHPTCELLLFAASRAQHLHTKILPALEAGQIVVCDRFADSSYAYQGIGRGFVDDVNHLEQFVLKGFEPDYTLFFDVTLEESARRLGLRAGQDGESNRLDTEAYAFKQRVYDGYQQRYHANPHRMHLIDAMQSMEMVQLDVAMWVKTVFIGENPRPHSLSV